MAIEELAPSITVSTFVQDWFDVLSRHEPVDELLPYVADDGLEMTFPETTLRSHADFRVWYANVGKAFTDQTHTVEELHAEEHADTVDLRLTVVWQATETANGVRSSFRVHQSWQLRKLAGDRLVIGNYQVLDLTQI